MRKLLVLLSVFLSSCSPVSQPASTQPGLASPEPTATSTTASLPLLTPIPPAISPDPTTDPNFFRDDFVGTLSPQWSWVREDPQNWSLTTVPGSLQINVAGGYVAAKTNANLLLRPAPTGDFQLETQISFRPEDNYQFAGVIIYESDTNFVQAGRSYCRSFDCIGEGLYMNFYEEGTAVEPNFGQSYKDEKPLRLRLSRNGDSYTFEASADGKVWFTIGSHVSDMIPNQIGLVTGQRFEGRTLPATFDYFEVRSLP